MDTTARLGLPYLAAGQLQKHVTLNEALTRLDALVQLSVVSRTVSVQPAGPADGALWILPPGATGAVWSTRSAGDLLRAEAGGWTRVVVAEGTLAWITDEDRLVILRDGVWTPLGGVIGVVSDLTRFGLNTTADAASPFTARLNTALWTAIPTTEGGDGDLRLILNKQTGGDVGSLVFQAGYVGRAELGLIGDNNLGLKVSSDGVTWRDALSVDRTTGRVGFAMGATRSETTLIHADATWTVPAWARRVEILAVGGAGGGGAGACGAAGLTRYGGAGGGAGGVSVLSCAASDLAASLTLVVGAAGSGGVGGTSLPGASGAAGGITTVSSGGIVILTGAAGQGGQGGGSSAASVGGAGGVGVTNANKGGDGSVNTTPGVGQSTARPDASGGGGAGAGVNSSNILRTGGAGGDGGVFGLSASGGAGGNGIAGAAGAGAANEALSWGAGGGGGGGASSTSAFVGGAGGRGAGGGGGGAGVVASGSGGVGGPGLVRITAIG